MFVQLQPLLNILLDSECAMYSHMYDTPDCSPICKINIADYLY